MSRTVNLLLRPPRQPREQHTAAVRRPHIYLSPDARRTLFNMRRMIRTSELRAGDRVDFAGRQHVVDTATLERETVSVSIVLDDGHLLYYSHEEEIEVER